MYDEYIRRRTEEAITGLTRNQFTGVIPVRGFESLRLRYTNMLFYPHTAAHAVLSTVLCDNQFPFYLIL